MPESVLVTQSPDSKKNLKRQSSLEMSLNDQSEPINLVCGKSQEINAEGQNSIEKAKLRRKIIKVRKNRSKER